MKKITFTLAMLLTAVLGISAAETTIWEGTQEGNLDFAAGSDLHTTLVNALKAGDEVNISYTGATEGNKLYIQDSSWDSYPNSMINITTDVLTAGNGVYKFTASQEFINKLKTDGLKLRRAGSPTYSFTKVTVTQGESGGEGGGGETSGIITIWEGTSTSSIYWAPESSEYNKLIGDGSTQANLAVGDKIKFYYTGAEEGTEIWIQANWDGLSGEGCMPAISGDGSHEFAINAADLAQIKTAGIRFRIGKGSCTFTKIEVIKKQESGGGESTGAIIVWEGSSTSNLRWTVGSEYYNKLVGDGEGQANLSAMDKIKFYYTGAAEADQVWFQNDSWNTIANIDPATPTITAGDGSYEFTVNAAAVEEIKTGGIMFRRPSSSSYTFTKVEVIKYVPDAEVAVPGADETVVWSGSVKSNSGKSFRYGDERANFIAQLAAGKFINVYMSNVVEGHKIFFKDCTTWGWLNDGNTDLTAGQQIYSIEITQEMIDKINVGTGDYGLLIQGSTSDTDPYDIRYVTISGSSATGISAVESAPARENGVAYNLQGQRVSMNTKGLIIINGKKFMNR